MPRREQPAAALRAGERPSDDARPGVAPGQPPRCVPAGANDPGGGHRAIACHEVSFVFPDGTRANDRISLVVLRGECLCLMGPNGAGKSTLIRQIIGQLRPSSGRIEILGTDATREPVAVRRRLGIIPQSAGLFDGLTVAEHLHYFGPLKHLSRAETRRAVEQILVEQKLVELRDRKAGALSGGQQRLLLLALALLGDPDILVLDEPTLGLDPVVRRDVLHTIAEQRRRGKTVLITTHYLDEAEQVADRIAFISHGTLQLTGSLRECYAGLGKTYKVTVFDEERGGVIAQHLCDSLAEAQQLVRAEGWPAFAVGRISLEDVYVRLVSGERATPGRGAGATHEGRAEPRPGGT